LFTYFLQGAGLGFSASVTPGPFLAFLMAQTLKNGWKRTLPASLAPLLSDGPIVILVLLVLTQTPAWLLSVLQVAGGLFILYLAKGALFARPAPETPNPELMAEAAHHNFVKAALMYTLSPGPYIFWSLIAGPFVLEAWRQSPGLGLSFVLGF
jgi:threonine/homoserine/homoserine lactone efflux protein